jgi:hypothetical protein
MAAPGGWEVLRGDARSLRDDLVALVARTALWAQLSERQREGAATLAMGAARLSASTGAVATLLRLGMDDAGQPAVASVSLGWLRTAPVLADLDLARLVLPDGEPVETGLGPGLLTRRDDPVPTGSRNFVRQVVAPVPQSIWLASITGATASPDQAGYVEAAVRHVARTLTVTRPASSPRADAGH